MVTRELADIFTRDLTRLAQELKAFPGTDAVWRTFPGITNAAGTLTLHLEGNLMEFVARQLGGVAYVQDRPAEFSTRGVALADLIARAERLVETIPPIVARVRAESLSSVYPDSAMGQGMSVGQFLIHLLAHLSYHLGQIDYLRRMTTGDGAITLAALTHSA
jgi:hypothetical protein